MQADQPQRQKFTIDGHRFSNMASFYDEVNGCLPLVWTGRLVGT